MTFSSASNSLSSPAFRALSAIRCLRASILAYKYSRTRRSISSFISNS
jgi:hypothetical protein